MKITTILGAQTIGSSYKELWCFTWNTSTEYKKYMKIAEKQFKGFFLKFETKEY